ncbi:MAG TPA: oligopeptide/dipeptide ABC transporter ATP-binding protein, partial [Micromonosporaceae bacterium]
GRPVDPAVPPTGCAFAARCPRADDHCVAVEPELVADASGAKVACWHPITARETIPGNAERTQVGSDA